MIVLKAQLSIHPTEKARFLQHMAALIADSRAEAGCLSFGCYEDVSAPDSFIVLEEWESHAALERHESSAHLAHFKAQVGPLIASREATRVYTVSQVSGLTG